MVVVVKDLCVVLKCAKSIIEKGKGQFKSRDLAVVLLDQV
jgi:hypothetical protein